MEDLVLKVIAAYFLYIWLGAKVIELVVYQRTEVENRCSMYYLFPFFDDPCRKLHSEHHLLQGNQGIMA